MENKICKASILKSIANSIFELIEKYLICFFSIEGVFIIILQKQINPYLVLIISLLIPVIDVFLLIKYVKKYNFIMLNGEKKIAKIEKVNIKESWNPPMILPKVELICVIQMGSSKFYLKDKRKTKSNIFTYSDKLQVYYINSTEYVFDFNSANIPDIYH